MFNIFFNLKIFYRFVFKVLNIVSFDQEIYMNMLSMKKCQKFEQNDQKNLLDGCSSILEFFSCKAYSNFCFGQLILYLEI